MYLLLTSVAHVWLYEFMKPKCNCEFFCFGQSKSCGHAAADAQVPLLFFFLWVEYNGNYKFPQNKNKKRHFFSQAIHFFVTCDIFFPFLGNK